MAKSNGKANKTRLELTTSPNMRLPAGIANPEGKKKALLAWVALPKFKNRKPTPDELVAECRKRSSPLYGLIEVDQKRAAGIYWRQIAQYYLRHINVVRINVRTKEQVGGPVRAFIPVEVSSGGHIFEDSYVPAGRVADDEELRKTVLDRAGSDIEAWIQRYERYTEFFSVFSPVIDAYRKVQLQIEQGRNGSSHSRKSESVRSK